MVTIKLMIKLSRQSYGFGVCLDIYVFLGSHSLMLLVVYCLFNIVHNFITVCLL